MKLNDQKGVSLIEMLVVVAIIGIIATLVVPYLKRAVNAAEDGATFAVTKIMAQEQVAYFSQNSRYARLDELNSARGNSFGTPDVDSIIRGKYRFTMSPPTPTNNELTSDFTIIATKVIDNVDVPYQISVSADGYIVQVIP